MQENQWLVFTETNFFSLRQLAIFRAFVFQIDLVLQEAERIRIKQAALACVFKQSVGFCGL